MEDEIKNYLPTVMFRGTLCSLYAKDLKQVLSENLASDKYCSKRFYLVSKKKFGRHIHYTINKIITIYKTYNTNIAV